jgi:lysophospholipase L1-like esterase
VQRLKRLLLAVVAVCTVLGACELVVRAWFGDGIEVPAEQRAMTRALLVGVERDGIRFRTRPGARYETNSIAYAHDGLGLRVAARVAPDSEPAAKAAGAFRVLCVGDSTTYRLGVAESQTWVRRLAADLDAHAPPARRFEVLNAGVPAYNTRDEAALLDDLVPRLAPDLVVLGWYPNDLERLGSHLLDDGSLISDPLEVPESWKPLLLHSWLYRRVAVSFCAGLKSSGKFELAQGENLTVPEQWLRELAAGLAARHVPLAIVEIPFLSDENRKWIRIAAATYPFRATSEWLERVTTSLGVPELPLLPSLEGQLLPVVRVSPTDQHPNGEASRLMAPAIGAFLRERRLVPVE